MFYGTLKAFVRQAAQETAAEEEGAELPLLPYRRGFSHRGSSSINRKASVNKTKAEAKLQSSVWAGAAAGLGTLFPPFFKCQKLLPPLCSGLGWLSVGGSTQRPSPKICGLCLSLSRTGSHFPGPTTRHVRHFGELLHDVIKP